MKTQIIYNKMVDVTRYSKTNHVLNWIKKLDQNERKLALKIIKDPNHDPALSTKEQRTLNSINIKLFTEVPYKKKGYWERFIAIFANLFGLRIASRKLIQPLAKAQKVAIPQAPIVKPQTPVQPIIKPPSLEEKFIDRLNNGTDVQRKKAYLYGEAKRQFEQKNCPNNLKTHQKVFHDPSWLKKPFNPQPVNFQNKKEFYDYEGPKNNVWVDFSNAQFGGGAGVDGFVQEEIMLVEFADLFKHFANHEDPKREFWSNIDIRVGTKHIKNRVGKGVPSPLLIQNAHRVQKVSPDLYGKEIHDISARELPKKVEKLDNPQEVNILAIAAPKLFTKTHHEQYHPDTLKDIFNQLMAGFTLAKEQDPNVCIHSGPFGCGAFNNSSKAVWFLHRLAAEQLGIDVVLHAYPHGYENEWNQLSPQLTNQNLENCLSSLSSFLAK